MLRDQSELKVKTGKLPMRGKNAGDQVVLGFSFASEWLDGWREFFLDQSGSEVQQGQGCFRICSTLTRKLLFHLHNTFF